MDRRTATRIVGTAVVVLLLLHLDAFRLVGISILPGPPVLPDPDLPGTTPPPADLRFGFLPDELALRLVWMAAATGVLWLHASRVWRPER